MTVQRVLRMGDPLLQQCATEITEFNSVELDRLIQDMLDTMHEENGAGLAAPQIGVSQQLVVFGFETNTRYSQAEPVPETILINPSINPLDDTVEDDWEGCLSVPGLRGLVPRYRNIEYSGFDSLGNGIKITATGFHARVVQHECDHLKGILYPQRMQDFSKFGYIDELLESGQLQTPAPDEELF
jgi:peptide deformylase